MSLKYTLPNKYILSIAIGVMCLCSFAQSDLVSTSITESYTSYFKTDRKTIHLHLNKNIFIAGENIWFSAYIYNQSKNITSNETEYIYVDLINDNGDIIGSKTILSKNAQGKGDLFLDENIPTGNYFLQAYNANMQNYEEDESTIYPIQIKNLESKKTVLPKYSMHRDTANIIARAESGNLITEMFNSVAVRITNQHGFGLIPDSLHLLGESKSKITEIKIDDNGFGTFSFLPQTNKNYNLIAYVDGREIVKELNNQKNSGYKIAVDRNHQKQQYVITLNSKNKSNEDLKLLVHKDGFILDFPINLNSKNKQAILLSYEDLKNGMNTISLIDSQGKALAERLIFNNSVLSTSKLELKNSSVSRDSIEVVLRNTNLSKTAIFSASILPSTSNSNQQQKKAFSSIHLEQYFELQHWQNLKYIDCETIEDLYYLDKLTLLANPKYNWANIRNTELTIPDHRESTSTLEGYINAFKEENDSLNVMLYSKENEVLLSTAVDAEKKFKFGNIALAKGSKIYLTLTSKDGKPIYANFFYTIKPSIENFRYRYKPIRRTSSNELKNTPIEPVQTIQKIEKLDEVTVTASRLKYQKFFKSFYGVKVDSTIGMTTLNDFLAQQGYYPTLIGPKYPDPRRAGSSQIGKVSKRCGFIFPSIMIDGKFDAYIDHYAGIRMEFIDEIYFDRATGCSAFVVVFTNDKYKNRPLPESEKISKEFVIESGYDIPKEFTRPNYFNTSSKEFTNFGVLSWHPSLNNEKQNQISLLAPINNQNELDVFVEGLTPNGTIISQSFKVDIKE